MRAGTRVALAAVGAAGLPLMVVHGDFAEYDLPAIERQLARTAAIAPQRLY